jgi:hypothetical protein
MYSEPTGEAVWICRANYKYWQIFCVHITRETSSANFAEPTGDNLFQEERQAASQLQPFTYLYNNSSFFLVVLTKNRCTQNTRWCQSKIAKESPEPQHWGYTNQLVLISNYLSFCWIIPLKGHYSLKSIKPISAFNNHKISFVGSM